ncbi:NAD-glutamate dehydrogenase [Pseudomonas sp. MYb185]|uniref:NAD-glutamate dehydrogenase n=1 Tax=Pseudomonas sp. MYb185 TaxID=1848729 RepID=UPI000CFB2094|nr:NAD-glutamate dehydrogenase [Pseudomonas sp. MYb185]PRB81350.1 NAD-glutamate dehydrogenase [Pseudomonas sp. MYb185]
MAFIVASSKQEFLQVIQQRLQELVEPREQEAIAVFARDFFSITTLQELLSRHDTDLLGSVLSGWRMLQQFAGHGSKVHVFNPDVQGHGWQSSHTVVQLLHADAPFLVDSVRIELQRQGYAIHILQNSVFKVARNADGQLQRIEPAAADGPGLHGESVMHIEIDRCQLPAALNELQTGLQQALNYVEGVVNDFAPMQRQVQELIGRLAGADFDWFDVSQREEATAFLDWLLDDNFTFLGYERFAIDQGLPEGRLGMQPQHSLGAAALEPPDEDIEGLPQEVLEYLRCPVLLSFAKSSRTSRVHRPAYPDYVSIREVNAAGEVVLEHRFCGLYTSRVYSADVYNIPWLRHKVEAVRQDSGFEPHSHLGKELDQVLQELPRDDLFQISSQQLSETALSIVQIQERNLIRLFLRRGNYGRFYYCLAYVPREIYSTAIRRQIQQVLMDRLEASDSEFWTFFSESQLARVQFILRVDPRRNLEIDHVKLERDVIQACRSWHDDFSAQLQDTLGEATATEVLVQFGDGFPVGYSDRYNPATGVADLQHLLQLDEGNPLAMSFYQPLNAKPDELHCKLYHFGGSLPLSDVMPILDNLGLRVLGEFPFQICRQDGQSYWVHDFVFTNALAPEMDIGDVNELFGEAFTAIWNGQAENDSFNRLILLAGIHWREAALMRALARYIKQIRMGFELPYLAATLATHAPIARELVRLFKTRFFLARKASAGELEEKLEQAIVGALEQVAVLNEDRILRRYLELIKACVRTNFYQHDAQGQAKDYISLKFDPAGIPELPLPRPMYEIFVYSPRVEGVHLRGGKVARGGLRWSDREEDYRTEVLGLVKAQQVKNAVIVPVGAKGGFVPRRLPQGAGRDAIQQEAIACYRVFIQGLLDITDNLIEGQVVPPEQVIRHDGDDFYLVVAADKGTASFSDIANGIAADYGFWLGDAFASGGSVGYDHKAMGITARGAWISVQRHFHELGINVQEDPVSAIGIGDMSGDVFGNGLLRSRSVRLLAAFNHQDIFIDPDPDASRSFEERQRLYDLPRSSWADYNPELISAGGGVFSRSLKQITLTPQIREVFDIVEQQLTPAELIHRLLKAPVDLLWNGGIGTYIKASTESHADVGDKTNDALRVDGRDLRCKVIGEGGNLGMTQLGRIEYCLNGGAANTDFIDNAGGVNCSDHEVNIKILLNEVVAAGDMTVKQRNALLAEMTEAVAALVLASNYKQSQAISLAQGQAARAMVEYQRFISGMEASGKLSRSLEFLPDDEQLADRAGKGLGLTRPELSVLISYSKADLKEQLVDSAVPEDPWLAREMATAFPPRLVREQTAALAHHRLRREIIATQLANNLVNHMGITFLRRLEQSTGASPGQIVAAYVVARDVFKLMEQFHSIEQLDHQLSAAIQLELMDELMRLARRATRWFIRRRGKELQPAAEVEHFAPQIQALGERFDGMLEGSVHELWQTRFDHYTAAGVPAPIARLVAGTVHFYTMLGMITAADTTGQPVERVAQVFFTLGSELQLTWFGSQINALPVGSHWQALAREAYRDELENQLGSITVTALQMSEPETPVAELVSTWLERNHAPVQRWQELLNELRSAGQSDYPMTAVAMRELTDLANDARQTIHGETCRN